MAFPDDPCLTCPFAGTGSRCHAQRVKHAPLCEPAFREFVLRRTTEDHANGRMEGPAPKAASYGPAPRAEAVHRGDPAPPWAAHTGPLDPRKELVVARYKEAIDWTAAVGFPVRVYNAGPEVASPADHVAILPKPNAGREEHSYLTHIVGRYDDLAELTIFCQAHPWDHSPDFLARLRPWYDAPTSLTTRYLEGHPPAYVKAHDKVERHHGFPVRYGDAGIKQHGEGHERGWFNPKAWESVFAVPRPDPHLFGYAATWAVPWWAIRRRPLSFWRWLLSQCEAAAGATCSWSDPPLNAWAMEALWLYLWSDPKDYPHRASRLA